MKISILGCGWLGHPLAQQLIGNGYDVKGSATSPAKALLLENDGIKAHTLMLNPTIEGDIASFLDAELLIIAIPPRAAKWGNNFHIAQMEALLPYLAQSKVQAIIYISSTSVYPDAQQLATEESPVITDSPLVVVENLLKTLQKQLTIIRFGGLMGYDRIPAKYFSGKTINTGEVPVNYIHRDDAIGAIRWIIEHHHWNETFNIVSPEHPIRKDVYSNNCKALGLTLPIFTETPQDLPYKIISPDYFIQKTGYRFMYENPLAYFFTQISPKLLH